MPVIPLPPRPQARNGTLAAAITLALGAAQAYAADPGDNLQEIVVTANRREQNLIDVPYNISAVSGVQLQAAGIATRVVSMPCVEWFNEQDEAYREEILPAAVRARVSVEAGIGLGWRAFVGDAGASVSLEHFGASASYQKLYEEFGFTAEHVVAAARASLARVRKENVA